MFESFIGHHRPKIRAANANINYIPDTLTRVAQPIATSDAVTEGGHLVQDRMDFGHDVLAVYKETGTLRSTQRHVKDSAILGDVYLLPAKHRIDPCAQIGFLC